MQAKHLTFVMDGAAVPNANINNLKSNKKVKSNDGPAKVWLSKTSKIYHWKQSCQKSEKEECQSQYPKGKPKIPASDIAEKWGYSPCDQCVD